MYRPAEEKRPEKYRHLPSNAILDPERKLFRLRKATGGTVNKGGFGVWIPPTEQGGLNKESNAEDDAADEEVEESEQNRHNEEDERSNRQEENAKEQDCKINNSDDSSGWYLFIEEAIYLHERGLLEVYDEKEVRMNGHDLYRLLPSHNVPLAVYLVYAHLKQQTFKVVRYSAERRRIIEEQIEQPPSKERQRLVPKLRQAVVQACLPPFTDIAKHLSWDVYPPTGTYQKREPGLPFCSVLVTSYTTPFSVERIRDLVQENEPVPIKVATVSDTGTVILFGAANLGAPSIVKES